MCAACTGLVVFSAMIFRGILAGQAPQGILIRSVIGLFAASVLGAAVGWIGLMLMRDNLASTSPHEPQDPAKT